MKIEKKVEELESEIISIRKAMADFFEYSTKVLESVVKHDKMNIAWELRRQQVEQMAKGDKIDTIYQIIKD